VLFFRLSVVYVTSETVSSEYQQTIIMHIQLKRGEFRCMTSSLSHSLNGPLYHFVLFWSYFSIELTMSHQSLMQLYVIYVWNSELVSSFCGCVVLVRRWSEATVLGIGQSQSYWFWSRNVQKWYFLRYTSSADMWTILYWLCTFHCWWANLP